MKKSKGSLCKPTLIRNKGTRIKKFTVYTYVTYEKASQ